MISLEEKVEASIMLGAYFDTIGFKDGKWEFNYGKQLKNLEDAYIVWLDMINEYYSLGGPDLNIKNWKVSDDTLLMIATGKACLNNGGYENYIKEYLNIYENLIKNERHSGLNTIRTLNLIKKLVDKNDYAIEKIPIEENMGGNGAAIRTSIIGIKWYNNEEKIIRECILASRITHNLPLGFLGGIVTALFTSYAIKNIEPLKWYGLLIQIYHSGIIQKCLENTIFQNGYDDDIHEFFLYWIKYNEDRLSQMEFRGISSFTFTNSRLLKLAEFSPLYSNPRFKNIFLWSQLGATGVDVLIWAYDSLLLSMIPDEKKYIDFDNIKYSFNSLLYYSCLNIGDSDSIGIIAGCWYGAYLGYTGIDKTKMKNIEFYKDLKKLSKNICKQIII